MTVAKGKGWSQRVTETSDALDLEAGVFTLDDPRQIAKSLKRSAECSERRKSDPFRSAMSMLTFYINRAGKQLSATQPLRLSWRSENRRAPPLRETWQTVVSKILLLRGFLHRFLCGLPVASGTGFLNAGKSVYQHFRRHRLRHILVRSIPRVDHAPVLKTGTTCSTA